MSQESKAGHLPQPSKIRLLLPYVTINRPGFSKSSKAKGQIPKEQYLKKYFNKQYFKKCLIIIGQHFTIKTFIFMHF